MDRFSTFTFTYQSTDCLTIPSPMVAIAQLLIIGNSLLDTHLWVLHLPQTQSCHLGHPLLEWFSLRRRDGLDEAEYPFRISCHLLMFLTIESSLRYIKVRKFSFKFFIPLIPDNLPFFRRLKSTTIETKHDEARDTATRL